MKDKSQSDGVEQNASESTKETRRRLLKGIVASAPVVASVASRPVFAANTYCSQSGQLSGNVSNIQNPETICQGEGCNVGFWRTNASVSPWSRSYPPDRNFDATFGLVGVFGTATLVQVLNEEATVELTNTGGCSDEAAVKAFAREAVAALLNAATNVAFDMNTGEVKETVQTVLITSGDCSIDGASIEVSTNSLNLLNGQGCPEDQLFF